MNAVLILGSGPNVVQARDWDPAPFDHILAINNAFAVRPDWDSLIHPEDFPPERRPSDLLPHQTLVTAEDYVAAQNSYGGFVYAGGTMAFTAGYWALYHHRPRVMAFMGCDMTYDVSGPTHFYGTGAADPLRPDVTLQSLEAKSARLQVLAAEQGCALVNLSRDDSRLIFERSVPAALGSVTPARYDASRAQAARAREADLGYFVPSGRYWTEQDRFDASKLREIDHLWLEAALAPANALRDT